MAIQWTIGNWPIRTLSNDASFPRQLSTVNGSSIRGGVWRASSIYAISLAGLLSCRWPQLLWVHNSQPCGVQKTAFHIMSPYPPALKFFYIPFWDDPWVLGSSSLTKVSHLRHDTQFLILCTPIAAHCKTHSLWPRLRTAQVYRKKKCLSGNLTMWPFNKMIIVYDLLSHELLIKIRVYRNGILSCEASFKSPPPKVVTQ